MKGWVEYTMTYRHTLQGNVDTSQVVTCKNTPRLPQLLCNFGKSCLIAAAEQSDLSTEMSDMKFANPGSDAFSDSLAKD